MGGCGVVCVWVVCVLEKDREVISLSLLSPPTVLMCDCVWQQLVFSARVIPNKEPKNNNSIYKWSVSTDGKAAGPQTSFILINSLEKMKCNSYLKTDFYLSAIFNKILIWAKLEFDLCILNEKWKNRQIFEKYLKNPLLQHPSFPK